MGRRKNKRSRSKKNGENGGGGGGPDGGGVGGAGGGGGDHRTYLKIQATFKCSNDKCGKTWTSVHAWERDEDIYCEFCEGGKCVAEKFLDEMCKLSNYDCTSCEAHWQSIYSGDDNQEQCDCGRMVTPKGTQERFGRHFWFVCTNPGCGVEWEDFSLDEQRTQRCSKCPEKARGDIIGTRKVKSKPFWLLKREMEAREGSGGGGGAGKHNAEYCDMCYDLKRQNQAGRGGTCLSYRKGFCKLQGGEGVVNETIVGTSID